MFSIYFMSVALNFCLKIPINSQTFLEVSGEFLDPQPFRESHWCSELEFQGIPSPVGY